MYAVLTKGLARFGAFVALWCGIWLGSSCLQKDTQRLTFNDVLSTLREGVVGKG